MASDVVFVAGSQLATIGGGSVAVAKPTGVLSGDILLALVFYNPNEGAAPSGGPWTEEGDFAPGGDRTKCYSKVAGGSEPATYTFTGTGGSNVIAMIVAYREEDQVAPIDVDSNVVDTGTVASKDAPSITTTKDGDRIVALFMLNANVGGLTVLSFQAGYTKDFDQQAAPFGSRVVALSKAQDAKGATGIINCTLSGDPGGSSSRAITLGVWDGFLAVSSAGAGRGAGIVRPPAVPSIYVPRPQNVVTLPPARGPFRLPGRRVR